jgi:hypothetical protein
MQHGARDLAVRTATVTGSGTAFARGQPKLAQLCQGETVMATALAIGKWLIIADFAVGMLISLAIAAGWIDPAAIILKIASAL